MDFFIRQPVAGLVKQHETMRFFKPIQQQMFVQSKGFAQHSFEIIPIDRMLEMFFGNRYADRGFGFVFFI